MFLRIVQLLLQLCVCSLLLLQLLLRRLELALDSAEGCLVVRM